MYFELALGVVARKFTCEMFGNLKLRKAFMKLGDRRCRLSILSKCLITVNFVYFEIGKKDIV